MGFLTDKLPAILIGIGVILLLALLTRGNLRGSKESPVKGCEHCTCRGQGCHNQQSPPEA